MPKHIPIMRSGFSLGVKASYDPASVPVNALHKAQNIRSDESGILRIRRGIDLFGTSFGAGMIQGVRSMFGDIVAVWNRTVYRVTASGSATAVGSAIVGASANDRTAIIRWSYAGAEIGYLFAGNGVIESDGEITSIVVPYTPATGEKSNLIRAADGTQNVTSGPSKCRIATLKASLSQRIALAGNPDSPNTIYLSAPLDASYFPSDQVIQLPDDGSVITGMINWYNALVVFRDKDIWAFFGSSATDSAAALVLQDGSIGCEQGNTIAVVPGVGVMFLGADNVYALQGVTGVENQIKPIPMGDDIRNLLLKALPLGLVNVNAVYYDREYRLCFPDCTETSRVFRFSMQNTPAWYVDTGPLTARFLVHDNRLYGLDRIIGQLYVFSDSLTDNGVPIPYFAAFRRENLQPGPARIKKIYLYAITKGAVRDEDLFFFGPDFNEKMFGAGDTAEVVINTSTDQNIRIEVVVDNTEYQVKDVTVVVKRISASDLAEHEPVLVYEARFEPSLKGNFAQLRIYSVNPDEDIAILGYGIEYSNRQRIHGIKNGVTV